MKTSAIGKLLDYTASGVGAIAGPMLAQWTASREAKARLAAARIDAETRRIEAESEAETSAIIAKARADAREYLVTSDAEIHGTAEITREDIIQRIEFQGRKHTANLKSVVDDAAEELEGKEVDDHEPDPDWTARFFDCVQDVSSEDMQKIWAKILAGEVESPGRTSLRTLDVLKNMTKGEAETFRDVCNFVLGGEWIFFDTSYTNDIDALKYGNMLDLQDYGLITLQSDLGTNIHWGGNKNSYLTYQNQENQDGCLWIRGDEKTPEVLGIPAVVLTAAGRELFQLVECTPCWEYLKALARFLESKNCRLHYLSGGVQLPDGRTKYKEEDAILISPEPDQPGEATP